MIWISPQRGAHGYALPALRACKPKHFYLNGIRDS